MAGKLSFSIALNLLTENFRKGAGTVKNSFRSMQMQILAFTAALGAGGLGLSGLLTRFKDVARETSRVTTALKNVSNGIAGFADNLRFVNDLAAKYGLEVNALTGNFAKFTASATQANMPMEEQKKVFESLSRASTAFALSAEDTNGVFLALSQMMGKGKISSEELRKQMGERIPVAMQAMAKAAGVSMAGLEKLLKQGKLISSEIIPKFADALNEMIPNVDTDNLEASLNRLSNAFGEIVNASGFQEKYKALIDGLNSLLQAAGKNVQNITVGIVAAIGFVATAGLTKVWKSYSVLASKLEAASIKSNAQLLNAVKARTAAEVELESAKNALINASSSKRLAAKQRLANAEIALTQARVTEEKALEATKEQAQKAADALLLANKEKTAIAYVAIARKKAEAELELEEAKLAALIANDNERLAAEQRLKTAETKLSSLAAQEIQANEAAKSAAAAAASVKTASNWSRAYSTVKAGAAKLAVSLKAMWNTFAPAVIISAIIAIAGYFRNLYQESKRIKNIFSDYRKEAENTGNTLEIKMLQTQLDIMNDKTKSQKEINAAQEALQEMLGDEKLSQEQINEKVKKRIELLKEAARADFLAQKAVEVEDKIKTNASSIGLTAEQVKKLAEQRAKEGKSTDYYNQIGRAYAERGVKGTYSASKADKIIKETIKDLEVLADANEELKNSVDFINKNTKTITGEDKDKNAESLRKKRLEAEEWLLNKQKELENEKEKSGLEHEQRMLDLEEDGFNKRQKQNELNYRKELLSIKQFEAEKRKEQFEAAKKIYVSENGGNEKGFDFNVFDMSKLPEGLRPGDIQSEIANRETQATEEHEKATTDLLKSMLDKYRDYNEQRKEINKQYSDDETALVELRNEKNASAIDAALAELKKAREKAIKEINDTEAKEFMKSTDLFVELFENASEKSVGELKSVIDKATELRKVLKDSSADIPEWFIDSQIKNKETLSPEQLNQAREAVKKYIEELRKQPGVIKDYEDAVKSLLNSFGDRSPLLAFSRELGKGTAKIKEGAATGDISKTGEGVEGISNAVQQLTPVLEKFGDDLGKIFGDGVAEFMKGLTKAIGTIAEIGSGVGKIMSGDVSGILDVVSGVAKIFEHSKQVNKEHREALRLLEMQVEEQKHLYNLEKQRASLAFEKGTAIYGSDKWGKASNAAKVYNDTVKQLDKSLKALKDVDVVTGSKTSGWWFWKKQKDVWSDLLSAYPDLIDANGKFNKSLAETILAERTLTDDGRRAIQQAIDNTDLLEEAFAEMKNYLSGIFGDIGNSMMDAFVDAFKGVKNALSDFADSAGDILGKLVKDFIYSIRLAPIIEKASEDAEAVMKDKNLTEEQKNQKLTEITGNLVDDLLNQGDNVFSDLEYWGKVIEEKTGKNPYASSGVNQTASFGSSQGMDQDTGNRLIGIFTALQMSGIKIEGLLSAITVSGNNIFNMNVSINDELQKQTGLLNELKKIQLNSFYEIEGTKSALANISGVLERIDKNTGRL
jgi:tape measure domain-containing protein